MLYFLNNKKKNQTTTQPKKKHFQKLYTEVFGRVNTENRTNLINKRCEEAERRKKKQGLFRVLLIDDEPDFENCFSHPTSFLHAPPSFQFYYFFLSGASG